MADCFIDECEFCRWHGCHAPDCKLAPIKAWCPCKGEDYEPCGACRDKGLTQAWEGHWNPKPDPTPQAAPQPLTRNWLMRPVTFPLILPLMLALLAVINLIEGLIHYGWLP